MQSADRMQGGRGVGSGPLRCRESDRRPGHAIHSRPAPGPTAVQVSPSVNDDTPEQDDGRRWMRGEYDGNGNGSQGPGSGAYDPRIRTVGRACLPRPECSPSPPRLYTRDPLPDPPLATPDGMPLHAPCIRPPEHAPGCPCRTDSGRSRDPCRRVKGRTPGRGMHAGRIFDPGQAADGPPCIRSAVHARSGGMHAPGSGESGGRSRVMSS